MTPQRPSLPPPALAVRMTPGGRKPSLTGGPSRGGVEGAPPRRRGVSPAAHRPVRREAPALRPVPRPSSHTCSQSREQRYCGCRQSWRPANRSSGILYDCPRPCRYGVSPPLRQPRSRWLSRGPARTAPSRGPRPPPEAGILLPLGCCSDAFRDPTSPSLVFSWLGQPLPAPDHTGQAALVGPVSSLESWFTVSWGRGGPWVGWSQALALGRAGGWGWGLRFPTKGPLPPSPDPTGAPGADPPGRKSGASA